MEHEFGTINGRDFMKTGSQVSVKIDHAYMQISNNYYHEDLSLEAAVDALVFDANENGKNFWQNFLE